jgi:hypothetical protein
VTPLYRGLFRAWIVGSVVWLFVAAWLSGFGVMAYAAMQGQLVTSEERRSQLGAVSLAGCHDGRPSEAAIDCEATILRATHFPATYDDAEETAWSFAYIGLSVPCGMVALGLGIVWAAASFRENRSG